MPAAIHQQERKVQPMRDYHRGDVFLADLGDRSGSEQGGRRPVVIMQNDSGCIYSPTVTMVPMTTVCKKLRMKSHYILRYSDCVRYPSMIEADTGRLISTGLSGNLAVWIPETSQAWKKRSGTISALIFRKKLKRRESGGKEVRIKDDTGRNEGSGYPSGGQEKPEGKKYRDD